jgi:uncharacterized protein YjbI with pentapeptide repeats
LKVLLGIEEFISSLVATRLSRLRLVPALEYVGKLGLLLALLLWLYPGCKQRKQSAESIKQAAADARKSRHYVAWQTITSALGKPGNGGRADALNDLNQDGILLDGISLTGGVIIVGPLSLTNASMTRADLSDGQYEGVNFSGATFDSSKWENAFSLDCNFQGASFWDATLKNANFVHCDFGLVKEGKSQRPSIFLPRSPGNEGCKFTMCNFVGAEFPMGIWNSVSFSWCNLAYAHFWQPIIGTNVSIFCCNLFGATTASPAILQWAFHQRVAFTNIVSLEKWNYCVTNRMVNYQEGGPQFMEWASNQYNSYIVTNNPKAWLDWSRENLHR